MEVLAAAAEKTATDRKSPKRKRSKMIKLQAFRIAVTVSTLAMVIAASGAGQKWAH
jgi:hypothetical protein